MQGCRVFGGTSLLFSTICDKLALGVDMEKVFSERKDRILSLAFYLAANREAPLYGFSHWSRLHDHPHGGDIPSPRISELSGSIAEVRDSTMGHGSYYQQGRLFHASMPMEYAVPVRGGGPDIRAVWLHIYFNYYRYQLELPYAGHLGESVILVTVAYNASRESRI